MEMKQETVSAEQLVQHLTLRKTMIFVVVSSVAIPQHLAFKKLVLSMRLLALMDMIETAWKTHIIVQPIILEIIPLTCV